MTLALDTNVFVDLTQGRRPKVRERYIEAVLAAELMAASVIVHHELRFGVFASRDPEAAARHLADFLRDVVIEPLSQDDVEVAARIREALKRAGTPIGPYDLLIAGQALNRGWTLVTSNTREFSRIEGLSLEDWSL
ncbi:type II toxin-antitoxin system VapC family toxin [uncultured Caulobacter sp.]|uniref:type II toxin-antitoxin system VapC family toxin n=1 Tax=uncultured Caulobacter sp. TaxID=158749 RepID=UPI00262F2C1A|nr:type II toxin-antitoxin system VapC family toxin [uncultured Caulobacter sp.]